MVEHTLSSLTRYWLPSIAGDLFIPIYTALQQQYDLRLYHLTRVTVPRRTIPYLLYHIARLTAPYHTVPPYCTVPYQYRPHRRGNPISVFSCFWPHDTLNGAPSISLAL